MLNTNTKANGQEVSFQCAYCNNKNVMTIALNLTNASV